jgi:hypothetical protein
LDSQRDRARAAGFPGGKVAGPRFEVTGDVSAYTKAAVFQPGAFWYLGNVDKELGERVEKGVRTGQS